MEGCLQQMLFHKSFWESMGIVTFFCTYFKYLLRNLSPTPIPKYYWSIRVDVF